MIVLFEDYTYDLTEEEIREAESVLQILKKRDSNNPWVNNKKARGRRMIQFLRGKGNFILANSRGYYMKSDKREKEIYLKSFRQRINSMNSTLKILERGIR